MTSSMLAGERRWASSRRGGMTVLGKVAVPKPINLPSQKLENHGLDPNVEIVPKGSLSWGSRPSSSTSNPWGSSVVSPNADGAVASPHYSSGRPTSGGGLSRPSTAGSDRHDPSATTWGPNSRPSSASGVLTSNQSSLTSSRPLSAETRPGSSHLSRFAEPGYDNSGAWGPHGTADKPMPSKVNDFSLSSGDFPTLGSEKDNTSKSDKSHDYGSHVRPGSGSGRFSHVNDRNEMAQADHRSETVDTWRRDGSSHFDDGVHPNADQWQGDPHQFMNPNVPPQHYDAWPGPPMNAPYGAWYRGPPYPHVPHGGFPMESFSYYRPQIPPPLTNSQSGPPPGPGPRGHHPRNGDFYRPQMPDAFIRPGMPIRPGFYPGPIPYDGYYGPPMGYNSNDHDMPFMGMPPGPHGPPVYNMYPPQNPTEHNDPHFRGGIHGPSIVSEQLDSFPPGESHGPYKVFTKREDERDADVEEDSWEHNVDKSDHLTSSFYENEQGADNRRLEDMPPRRNRSTDYQGYPSDPVIVHPPQGPHKSKSSNESWGNKSSFPENPKDPTLIQKIEDLNAKARGSDIQRDTEKANKLLSNSNNSAISFGSISVARDFAHPSDKSRQAHHGVRNRADHHSAGRLSNHDSDGWRKTTPSVGSDVAAPEIHVSSEIKEPGEFMTQVVDPADSQAQRAKIREMAKQRAIELQKEEEERIREQKAKALAKLEELNRRTLAGADGTTQTAEKASTIVFGQEDVDGSQKPTEPAIDTKTEVVAQMSESSQHDIVDQAQVDAKSINTLGNDSGVNRQKRASHRSKQSVQAVESLVDKSTLSAADGEAVKNPGSNVTVSGEAVQSQESTLPNNSNILSESTQQKKRINKSSKNKHRHDDASASKEVDLVKPESPRFDSTNGKNATQSNLDQVSSLPSTHHKPQHSRRMPRNPQANKSHVGDAAMWAPVRHQTKEEVGQHDLVLPEKTVNSGLTNPKSKRAEMERYVPKPVAKELAQEGSIAQPTSVSSPKRTTLEDTADIQAIPVSGPTMDSKSGDYKPVKPRGAWHQRDQGVPQDSKKVIHKSTGQQHKEPDPVPTETGVVHEWDPSDGWFMPDEYPSTETTPVVKDEPQITGRGKKPAYKGQRSTVKNHMESGAEVEIDQTVRPVSSKDNRWQPKSQASKGGGQNTSSDVKKEFRKYSPRVQPDDELVYDEGRRERKPASYRSRTDSQNLSQGPGYAEDEPQAQFDHVSSGFRKYGGQNNRWSGQDDKRRYNNYQHSANTNREKPRQNLQYEYQPVGSNNYNNNKSSHLDAPADAAPRYKERGSGQSRRGGGNFYGRQ